MCPQNCGGNGAADFPRTIMCAIRAGIQQGSRKFIAWKSNNLVSCYKPDVDWSMTGLKRFGFIHTSLFQRKIERPRFKAVENHAQAAPSIGGWYSHRRCMS